jgi:hypothetical protein
LIETVISELQLLTKMSHAEEEGKLPSSTPSSQDPLRFSSLRFLSLLLEFQDDM